MEMCSRSTRWESAFFLKHPKNIAGGNNVVKIRTGNDSDVIEYVLEN